MDPIVDPDWQTAWVVTFPTVADVEPVDWTHDRDEARRQLRPILRDGQHWVILICTDAFDWHELKTLIALIQTEHDKGLLGGKLVGFSMTWLNGVMGIAYEKTAVSLEQFQAHIEAVYTAMRTSQIDFVPPDAKPQPTRDLCIFTGTEALPTMLRRMSLMVNWFEEDEEWQPERPVASRRPFMVPGPTRMQ